MKHFQDESLLEINITHTIEVTFTIKTIEEDMTFSCIVAAFSSTNERHLTSSSSLRAD